MTLHDENEAVLQCALARNWITRRQVQSLQAELTAGGVEKAIGPLLIAKGYLTFEQLETLASEPPGSPPIDAPKPPVTADRATTGARVPAQLLPDPPTEPPPAPSPAADPVSPALQGIPIRSTQLPTLPPPDPSKGITTGARAAVAAPRTAVPVPPPAPVPLPVAPPPVSEPPTGARRQVMPSDLVEGEWIVRRESPLGATLEACRKQGASDFHWSPRAESSVRWYGQLLPWKATPLAARSVQEDLVYHLHKREREELDRTGATLSNAWLHDGWRVRFSLFRVPGGQSFTARVFRPDLPRSVEMGIPAGAAVGYDFQGGLFLIAGPQGSGRTTTLHAILRDILNSRPLPAVRILRSIDYEACPGLGVVTTWRVGRETPHMVDGLRDAPALSPRVVVIDDLTTGEECLAALDLAEQGVLVLATIRADSSSMAFGRFVEAVEPDSALFLAQRFCEHIRAILTQRLLPRKDVPGLILVAELLLGTPALTNVLRNARPNQIDAALRGGRRQGMIAIDDSLHDLVTRGVLDIEVAKRVTLNRQLLDKTKSGSTGPTASRPPTLPPGPPSSRKY